MENEIWQVESGEFDAATLVRSGIRVFYLEALNKLVREVEKENNYRLPTDTEKHYQKFIPTIIFSELYREETSNKTVVRLTCFADRKIFIQSLEAEGYMEEGEEE